MKEKEKYSAPVIWAFLFSVEAGSGSSSGAPADNEYGAGAGKLEYEVW